MAQFLIRSGLQANLPATAVEGTLYVTTDSKKVYAGLPGATAPVQLSNDLIILANAAAFDSLTVKPQDVLYYITDVNVLAKYNGTNLIQINAAGLTTVNVTGDGNVITAAVVTANSKGELILNLTKGITAATSAELSTLAGRVTTAEGKIDVIDGDASTTGSFRKAVADEATARDAAIAAAVGALDTTADVGVASKSGKAVTITGSVKEEDGIVKKGTGTDIVLADVASTGAAEDVSYTGTIDGTAVTNVDDALDALTAASAGGVASKTVWLKDDETVTTGYLKTYGIYQGANSPTAETNPATLIGKIDIPKDLVVTAGKVVTVEDGTDSDGETTSVADGTYVKLTIANQAEKIYINVHDLVDVYTAAQSAAQIQLAISDSNVISATVVAGSIGTTELTNLAVTTAKIDNNAVTSAKIADDAVTADKVSIAVHTESNTVGTDGIAVSVSTTDGQVSSVTASIAANTYDTHGAAAQALADAIGTSSDAASADTINGAKAYADAAVRSGLEWDVF